MVTLTSDCIQYFSCFIPVVVINETSYHHKVSNIARLSIRELHSSRQRFNYCCAEKAQVTRGFDS